MLTSSLYFTNRTEGFSAARIYTSNDSFLSSVILKCAAAGYGGGGGPTGYHASRDNPVSLQGTPTPRMHVQVDNLHGYHSQPSSPFPKSGSAGNSPQFRLRLHHILCLCLWYPALEGMLFPNHHVLGTAAADMSHSRMDTRSAGAAAMEEIDVACDSGESICCRLRAGASEGLFPCLFGI